MNLSPFLLFDGNCAEAMGFYQACLGGELTLTTVGDTYGHLADKYGVHWFFRGDAAQASG